jgi:hypothetical protein
MTGSQGLVAAGMVLQAAALALQIVAMLMQAKILHSGGLIMHQGGHIPVYAHSGWNIASDERLIIGQTGEYMISRRGVDAVGVPFLNAVNAGYVPQSGSSINFTYAPQVNAIDAKGVDKVLEKHGKQMLKNLKQSHRDYSYGRMITK